MLTNIRMARGEQEDEIILFCEPLKGTENEITSYMAVAFSEINNCSVEYTKNIVGASPNPVTC